MSLSRRGLFLLFARPLTGTPQQTEQVPVATASDAPPKVAVIQGRFCLAYSSICTVCVERCPVPGAIKSERGIPMIIADVCTGCGICREVCPAPTNAVLVMPRRRVLRFSAQ